MDLYRINSTNYQPDAVIQGYSSAIWTERYLDPGEFKVVTDDIEATRWAIPIDSFVGVRGSNELAVVETHLIDTDDNGVDRLTISGRTFDFMLGERVRGSAWTPHPMPQNADGTTNPDGNQSWAYSVTNAYMGIQTVIEPGIPWASLSPDTDLIHNVDVSLQGGIDPGVALDLIPGPIMADELVKTRLEHVKHGVRCIRPGPGSTTLGVQIYHGQDRRNTVQFRIDAGDMEKPSYLFSKKDYKNVAYVFSPLGSKMVFAPGVWPTVSGVHRRILLVIAADLTEVPPGGGTIDDVLNQRGWAELQKHNKTTWFDGVVTPQAQYKYKEHYDLGDIVRIVGRYGLQEDMRVSEYIRIDDKEGDRGYPTLVVSD